MTGLMATGVAVAGLGVCYRAAAVDAVAELERLARPHLAPKAADSPALRACRRDLAERLVYLKRVAGRKLDTAGYFNLLQLLRDTAQLGCWVVGSPWDELACWRASLRCAEAVYGLHVPFRPSPAPPGVDVPSVAPLRQLEACVHAQLGRCVRGEIADLERRASLHLIPLPDEPPLISGERRQLAERVGWLKQTVSRLDGPDANRTMLLNALVLLEDIRLTSEAFAATPGERLVWRLKCLRLAEGLWALHPYPDRLATETEATATRFSRYVAWRRWLVAAALAECLRPAAWPIR